MKYVKPFLFIIIMSLLAVTADRAMGQSTTNGLPDIFLPKAEVQPNEKEDPKEKEEEDKKKETEVCCNPQIDIYIHAVPSEGKFYVSLGWHSYCFGPPYVTVGIEVKSICGWQTLVDPHTKWPLPPGAWKGFELSPLYTTVLVDGRVECACGNAGTNSKSAGYGGAPLGYIYWLMKQIYRI